MLLTIFILAMFCLLLSAILIFLVLEYLKKFKYIQKFIHSSNQLVKWNYPGSLGQMTGMRNIVLRAGKPFSVLVGFKLGIPIINYSGFDYYGYVECEKNNIVVFATYLGKNPCQFELFVSTRLDDNPITVSSNVEDQNLIPQSSFLPHWFQRMGFYG